MSSVNSSTPLNPPSESFNSNTHFDSDLSTHSNTSNSTSLVAQQTISESQVTESQEKPKNNDPRRLQRSYSIFFPKGAYVDEKGNFIPSKESSQPQKPSSQENSQEIVMIGDSNSHSPLSDHSIVSLQNDSDQKSSSNSPSSPVLKSLSGSPSSPLLRAASKANSSSPTSVIKIKTPTVEPKSPYIPLTHSPSVKEVLFDENNPEGLFDDEWLEVVTNLKRYKGPRAQHLRETLHSCYFFFTDIEKLMEAFAKSLLEQKTALDALQYFELIKNFILNLYLHEDEFKKPKIATSLLAIHAHFKALAENEYDLYSASYWEASKLVMDFYFRSNSKELFSFCKELQTHSPWVLESAKQMESYTKRILFSQATKVNGQFIVEFLKLIEDLEELHQTGHRSNKTYLSVQDQLFKAIEELGKRIFTPLEWLEFFYANILPTNSEQKKDPLSRKNNDIKLKCFSSILDELYLFNKDLLVAHEDRIKHCALRCLFKDNQEVDAARPLWSEYVKSSNKKDFFEKQTLFGQSVIKLFLVFNRIENRKQELVSKATKDKKKSKQEKTQKTEKENAEKNTKTPLLQPPVEQAIPPVEQAEKIPAYVSNGSFLKDLFFNHRSKEILDLNLYFSNPRQALGKYKGETYMKKLDAADPLEIEKLVEKHFLYQYELSLAQEIFSINLQLMKQLTPLELSDVAKKTLEKKVKSEIASFSSRLTYWVRETLLAAENTKQRLERIDFFCKIRDHLLFLKDYGACSAIYLGLELGCSRKLTATMNSYLAEKESREKTREFYEQLFFPDKQYQNMKKQIAKDKVSIQKYMDLIKERTSEIEKIIQDHAGALTVMRKEMNEEDMKLLEKMEKCISIPFIAPLLTTLNAKMENDLGVKMAKKEKAERIQVLFEDIDICQKMFDAFIKPTSFPSFFSGLNTNLALILSSVRTDEKREDELYDKAIEINKADTEALKPKSLLGRLRGKN